MKVNTQSNRASMFDPTLLRHFLRMLKGKTRCIDDGSSQYNIDQRNKRLKK